ncbi:MAG TPA: lipid A deacylase LpxR family protein [Bacteroidia bacterium]|nr:lipid A deacylase LpxR family protein [Bacteroidia bacterium]
MLTRLLILFQLLPVFISAQEKDTVPLLRSFGIAYENDLLVIAIKNNPTDYYYTGGSFIEFNLPCLIKNPLSKILVKLPHGRNESFGISASNLGFTPTSIQSDSILTGDRPFSGTLYLGFNRVSCNGEKQVRLTSRLDLGVIGPGAFGYETQKFIHAHTNNPEPHGWQFQVANDVYVNYSLKLEKGLLAKKHALDLTGYGIVNAGTVYTNAGLGLKIRAGRMNPYFTAPGYSNRLQVWVYASAESKVIARDATLQGGLFNTSSAYFIAPENMKRILFSGSAGIVFAFHRLRVEYYNTFISPEFVAGKAHAWGHLGMHYVFGT